MRLILLIILIIVVVGALPSWPYSAGWGYYPAGGLGTILVILIVLALVGVLEPDRQHLRKTGGRFSSPLNWAGKSSMAGDPARERGATALA